jgi:peptidoglycan/LPS O-acetylase OafA/YrhL
VQATCIFIAILAVVVLLSFRKKNSDDFFPLSTTNELKGLAILLVIFGHIGYFLVSGNLFLFPISNISGVGVDLFLFLSGYGLVVSALKKPRTIGKFYNDRLLKLLVPFWLVLILLFLADFFILNKTYSLIYMASSFLGFFPTANLYADIDSPLWYFTLILFYYLIFPLVFIKKRPWVSAIIIYAVSALIIFNVGFIGGVRYFYDVHSWAFPIGMVIGWGLVGSRISQRSISATADKDSAGEPKALKNIGHYALIAILVSVIAYTSYHSGVGKGANIEQFVSLITVSAFVVLFLAKRMEIRLFSLFGLYSYEIYLLHWPILYRYDIFFRFFPGWLSMVLYLALFIGLGWALKTFSGKILSTISKEK